MKKTSGSSYRDKSGLTHYERNKQSYYDRVSARKAKIKDFVYNIKSSNSCKDCGNGDARVLEFDHLPGYEKSHDLSKVYLWGWSEKKILEEVAKCDIVCANCHRIRTCERREIP